MFLIFQLVQTAKTTAAIIVFKISVGVIVGRDSCSVKDIKRPGNISRPSSQIQGLFKDIEGHVSANSRTKY